MVVMLMVASKLLEGKPYAVTSDNPETIRRCISLAKHMGASIDEIRKGEFLTQLILVPASCPTRNHMSQLT
jgi:hypothetical protein